MPHDPVRLRPIEEADLDVLSRLDTDPTASQPFEWTGFGDPQARRRRWEEDGWLGPRLRPPRRQPARRDPGRDRGLAFIGGRWHDGTEAG
jgi:hypothetical protein